MYGISFSDTSIHRRSRCRVTRPRVNECDHKCFQDFSFSLIGQLSSKEQIKYIHKRSLFYKLEKIIPMAGGGFSYIRICVAGILKPDTRSCALNKSVVSASDRFMFLCRGHGMDSQFVRKVFYCATREAERAISIVTKNYISFQASRYESREGNRR